jgi:hypothetical protein
MFDNNLVVAITAAPAEESSFHGFLSYTIIVQAITLFIILSRGIFAFRGRLVEFRHVVPPV